MVDYNLGDGRIADCGRNYRGWIFPNTEEVPVRYRGKEFDARFCRIKGNDMGCLIIDTKGADRLVMEEKNRKEWTDEQNKLVQLVLKLVPSGL